MPNKDLRKYNKGASSLPMKAEGASSLPMKAEGASSLPMKAEGASSLPMKAEGEAPLFFHFFAHFLLRREILEEVKKNLYIFGGGGEF
jgi:hypothetical protein